MLAGIEEQKVETEAPEVIINSQEHWSPQVESNYQIQVIEVQHPKAAQQIVEIPLLKVQDYK